MRTKNQDKITGSYSIPKPVREDLKAFSHYANRTESEVITMALEAFFKSDRAFSDLQAAERSKLAWMESLYEDCCDFANLVCAPDLLIRRAE